MFTITVSEKGGQQSTFEFNKPEITIGRMKGNDIVLPKGNVSKRHSRIFAQEGAFSIIDLESTNGTYVNGRKITGEQSIGESDKIYIGDFIIQVEQPDARPQAPPAPPPGNPRSPSGPQPGPQDRGGSPSGMQPPADQNRGGMNSSGMQQSGGRRQLSSGNNPLAGGGPPQPPSGPADALGGGGMGGGGMGGGGMGSGMQSGNEPSGGLGGLGGGMGDSSGSGLDDYEGGLGGGAAPSPRGNGLNGGAGGAALGGPPAGQSPQAPRLDGNWPPPQQDEATVDRMGDRMMPRPEYSHVSAVLASNELESEFDADFHAAQMDVARVLFESITPQDLPLQYPPNPDDETRLRGAVENAVNTVSPRVDRDELINLMTAECVGLGPVDAYLDDDAVRDVYVNRFDQVLVRKNGKLYQAARAFSHPHLLQAAAYRILGPREMEVFTDELRFNDGTKVHVILPPLAADGPAITVRKPPATHPRLDDLIQQGAVSGGMAEFLTRATEAGRSILIAGPTSAGKTTLLSALTAQLPAGVRVVAIEDDAHLDLSENAVRLESNPSAGYDARYLIRAALAMHPQRIVLDECRGAEAYDWVTAAACGTEGSMVTLHGTSASDALGRLESLCLLGSTDVSPRGLREQISRAVNVVVVVNRVADGFRVQQITEVQGVDLDAFRLNDIFYYRVEGTDGAFHPTGYIPLFYEDLRHAGVEVDFGIFRE